jgi:immune inhibitor A
VKRRTRGIVAVAAAGVTMLVGAAFGPAAIAAPADSPTSEAAAAQRLDNRPGPLTKRQNERRKAAQKLILSGQAAPGEDGVVQLAEDKYYEASVTGTGRLFTILSEFGDQGSGKLGTTPGPLHNAIAEPDRTGRPTSTRPTTRSSSSVRASRSPTSTRSSLRASTRSRVR